MRVLIAAAAASSLWGVPSGAQDARIDIERGVTKFEVDEAEQARFRACRTAAFVHLDEPERPEGLPRRYAETHLAIIDFIISELIRDFRSDSLAAGRETLRTVESFFLAFSRTVAEEAERFRDAEAREAFLIECLPFLWRFAGERIDYLMLWRERAIDAPSFEAGSAR